MFNKLLKFLVVSRRAFTGPLIVWLQKLLLLFSTSKKMFVKVSEFES